MFIIFEVPVTIFSNGERDVLILIDEEGSTVFKNIDFRFHPLGRSTVLRVVVMVVG